MEDLFPLKSPFLYHRADMATLSFQWSHVSLCVTNAAPLTFYLALQMLHVVRLCTASLSQLICLKQQSTVANSVDVRTVKEATLSNERS